MTQPVPAITQAMIDAYDEYTHLTLDRRGFMARLTGLAGSAAAAAAIAPMLAASPARAAIVAEDDPAIVSAETEWQAAGAAMKGTLVRPAAGAGPFPGVVVIHENRGLNGHIRDVARRMAKAGFVALAPDFLSDAGGTPEDEDRAREMIGALDPARTAALAVGTRAWLAGEEGVARGADPGPVGAVGFCWGGGLVGSLAVADPGLGAGVSYYGRQPPAEEVAKVRAPLLLHYAGLDERINAGIPAFEAALKAAGTDYRLFRYEGVNHAFNNDTSAARYDKAASDLAWERTVSFLREKLAV